MNLQEFLSIEADLASSQTAKLDLSKATPELMSHYLRAWRGRVDLAQVIERSVSSASAPESESVRLLNEIRSLLRADELDQAWARLHSVRPGGDFERAEFGLEECRYYLFKRDFKRVIEVSEPLLGLDSCSPQTLMSLYQVRGIAKTYSDQPQTAVADLEKAIALSACLPSAPTAFSCYTVLVQTYSRMKDRLKASELLEVSRGILERSVDNDLWLERLANFQRARIRYAEAFEPRCEYLRLAAETEVLSDWLGLKVNARLCRLDLGGEKVQGTSLPFLGGRYLPGLKLALMDHPRRLVRLEDSPQSSKIMELLCQGDQPVDELFKRVWGYGYQEENHSGHVRTMLSKLRKKLGDGYIVTRNKRIALTDS